MMLSLLSLLLLFNCWSFWILDNIVHSFS